MDKSKKIVNYFDFYSNELWTRLLTVVLNTAIIGIVYSGVSPGRCAKFLLFFNFSIHSIEFGHLLFAQFFHSFLQPTVRFSSRNTFPIVWWNPESQLWCLVFLDKCGDDLDKSGNSFALNYKIDPVGIIIPTWRGHSQYCQIYLVRLKLH